MPIMMDSVQQQPPCFVHQQHQLGIQQTTQIATIMMQRFTVCKPITAMLMEMAMVLLLQPWFVHLHHLPAIQAEQGTATITIPPSIPVQLKYAVMELMIIATDVLMNNHVL